MNLLTNANAIQLWTVGLFVAVMFGIFALTAVFILAWKQRPEKRDVAEECKLRERLSQIAEPMAESRKSA